MPFQSNTNFNTGPFNRTQEVFNIQPVVPMHLNEDWNVISRTIIPLVSQPSPFFDSNTNGIGDITQSLFLSPAHPRTADLGRGSSLYHSLRQRSHPRHREILARTNSRVTGHTATLGDRRIAQQPVVGRRQSTATAGEHLPRPAVRQLQHGARLVLTTVTHYHRELARGVGREVDCAGRRRHRSGFQSRRSTDQRIDCRLLQRDPSDWRSHLGTANYCVATVPSQIDANWRATRLVPRCPERSFATRSNRQRIRPCPLCRRKRSRASAVACPPSRAGCLVVGTRR